MQKAIRLGLAVDESLTNSQIGEYINYRTAAYWRPCRCSKRRD